MCTQQVTMMAAKGHTGKEKLSFLPGRRKKARITMIRAFRFTDSPPWSYARAWVLMYSGEVTKKVIACTSVVPEARRLTQKATPRVSALRPRY